MAFRPGKRFWIVATAIILVFTIFVVGRNLLHAVGIRREIGALERKRATYLQRIAEDSTLIERLQYDDYLEEYARAHYRSGRRCCMPAGDVVPRRAEDRAAQNARRIVFSVGSGLIRLFSAGNVADPTEMAIFENSN